MSEEKKQLLPRLRFEEFGKHDEWNSYKLEDTTQILTGGTPSTKVPDYWYPKEIPWMSSGEINKKRLFETDNFISENGFENSSATWIKKHSVLIALAGQGKTRGTVAINEIPLTTNQSIAAILPFENKIYSEFLYYNLDNRYEELRLISSGDGTRGGLNKEIISSLKFIAPNIFEQKKISNFLKKLDEMIQLQQSKVNKTKDIKSAYLSEMFPKEGGKYPKRRFEGFTEPWRECSLGEIVHIKTGNTNVQDAISDGKYTFFDRSTDIKRIDKYYYDEEAIIYPGEGSEFYPRYFKGRYALHQRAYSITSDNVNSINMKYLLYMMMLRNNHFVNNAVGSTVKSLRMNNFYNCLIFLPSPKEQQKIGEFFKNLDTQIANEEEKLAKLEQLKQAYLNDMFV